MRKVMLGVALRVEGIRCIKPDCEVIFPHQGFVVAAVEKKSGPPYTVTPEELRQVVTDHDEIICDGCQTKQKLPRIYLQHIALMEAKEISSLHQRMNFCQFNPGRSTLSPDSAS